MTDERDPQEDPLPEDPQPPKPQKKRKRKPKALAPYSIRYKGKRYVAEEYRVEDGCLCFSTGNKKTYIPLAGPVEIVDNRPGLSTSATPIAYAELPPAHPSKYQLPQYALAPPNPEADRFMKSRNNELAALSGFGGEFGL